MIIERILREHDLRGKELVVFGDGYVEIENGKAVGGIAVGVATDEERREGVDLWKRDRLISAGADLIIPEFREHARLLATSSARGNDAMPYKQFDRVACASSRRERRHDMSVVMDLAAAPASADPASRRRRPRARGARPRPGHHRASARTSSRSASPATWST